MALSRGLALPYSAAVWGAAVGGRFIGGAGRGGGFGFFQPRELHRKLFRKPPGRGGVLVNTAPPLRAKKIPNKKGHTRPPRTPPPMGVFFRLFSARTGGCGIFPLAVPLSFFASPAPLSWGSLSPAPDFFRTSCRGVSLSPLLPGSYFVHGFLENFSQLLPRRSR